MLRDLSVKRNNCSNRIILMLYFGTCVLSCQDKLLAGVDAVWHLKNWCSSFLRRCWLCSYRLVYPFWVVDIQNIVIAVRPSNVKRIRYYTILDWQSWHIVVLLRDDFIITWCGKQHDSKTWKWVWFTAKSMDFRRCLLKKLIDCI